MSGKPVKDPGAQHPITVEANLSRVIVEVAGRVVADCWEALTMREATYPPVH